MPNLSRSIANRFANGAYTTVNFPAGRFTVPPLIQATCFGTVMLATGYTDVTTTSAKIAGFASGGTAAASSWSWTAIQMTSTSAAG